jgi:hypothetical protein
MRSERSWPCPQCGENFDTQRAMQQHFQDTHRAGGLVQATAEIPDSTISGAMPVDRCENCKYWGKGNGITVCRNEPGVVAMMQTQLGPTPAAMYPPKLANEWCGRHVRGSWPVESPITDPNKTLS